MLYPRLGHTEDGPPLMPITPPKHMTIPDIPRISELGFETLMLVFSLMSLALQYLNIYRTIFWLPHSHTKYAMVRTPVLVGLGLSHRG